MRRRTSTAISFSLVGLLATGCGTRVVREEGSQTQARPVTATPIAGDSAVPAQSALRPPEDVGTTTGPAVPAPSGALAVDSKGSARPQSAAPSNAASPGVPDSRPKTVQTSPGSSTGTPPPESNVGGGSPPGPPAPTKASPVVLASVGTYSGPIGTVLTPMLQATQAWVNTANARGGLNGHPVQLIVYDDGGDPAKSRAQVQEAVEKRRAIAFVQMGQPITGQCCIDYITAKRIPVIGSETGSPWFYDTSPMYFPQTGSGELLTLSAIYSAAQEAIPAGKTKLGYPQLHGSEHLQRPSRPGLVEGGSQARIPGRLQGPGLPGPARLHRRVPRRPEPGCSGRVDRARQQHRRTGRGIAAPARDSSHCSAYPGASSPSG